MEEVANFLKRFHAFDNIDDVFTLGCCYWFAHILYFRFPHSRIMYDQVVNHFGTEIDGRIYDITGDVTDKYDMIPWSRMHIIDPILADRIERDCISF